MLLLVGVLGLLQATLRRREQAAFVTAVRLKARHYRDSTFLAMHVDTLRSYSQGLPAIPGQASVNHWAAPKGLARRFRLPVRW